MYSLLKTAILELNNLKKGERFLIKDLFKGYVWNRLSKGERLKFRTIFMNEAKNNLFLNIIIIEKISNQ